MLEWLKREVYQANMELVKTGLVLFTWGNVSGIDRETQRFVIKPSGVPYEDLKPEMMVVVDLDGHVVEGDLKPSSDTPTHCCLYNAFKAIGGISHTHSTYATAWAQAARALPCYGTTHADAFFGSVPCTRELTPDEINGNYEEETGKVIVETFKEQDIEPCNTPGVLCAYHGPFTWGESADDAVYHAVVLEQVAKMAMFTEEIAPKGKECPAAVVKKHFERKHGVNAYYGQGKSK